jgi:hypothetical protein
VTNLPINAVHVEPISENQTEAINQIVVSLENTNRVLTLVLIGFAAIDMIMAVLPYAEEWEKSRNKSDSKSGAYQPE